MYYINDKTINELTIDWRTIIDEIKSATLIHKNNDFCQPIKPYLRYGNPQNRVIAMPAYIGGDIACAGIKWIASFPSNIEKNLPRAHSILVLNNAETGEPYCIFNTGTLSAIRTAAVSGLMYELWEKSHDREIHTIGVLGAGPIAEQHIKMFSKLAPNVEILVFDLDRKKAEKLKKINPNIIIENSWEEVYEKSNVFITCTVSTDRYIDLPPKKTKLILNVSLRDFKENIYEYVSGGIVVDDWDEVCRENTDIEYLHLNCSLNKEDTLNIRDIVNGELKNIDPNQVIMFNPMGMAIYDMSVANRVFQTALSSSFDLKIG